MFPCFSPKAEEDDSAGARGVGSPSAGRDADDKVLPSLSNEWQGPSHSHEGSGEPHRSDRTPSFCQPSIVSVVSSAQLPLHLCVTKQARIATPHKLQPGVVAWCSSACLWPYTRYFPMCRMAACRNRGLGMHCSEELAEHLGVVVKRVGVASLAPCRRCFSCW